MRTASAVVIARRVPAIVAASERDSVELAANAAVPSRNRTPFFQGRCRKASGGGLLIQTILITFMLQGCRRSKHQGFGPQPGRIRQLSWITPVFQDWC